MSKSRKTRGFFFNFAVVFLLVILLLLIMGIVREYLRQKELDKEVSTLEAEIERLNLDKKNFLSSIEAYQSDFFLEQEARTKFNLKKPGEKVAVIPSTTIDLIQSNNSSNDQEDNKKVFNNPYLENASAWWQYFFGVEI